jgi:pilus assembly protein CpaF
MSLLKRIGGTEGVNQTPYIPQSPAPPPASSSSAPTPPAPAAPQHPHLNRSNTMQEELVRRAPGAPQKDGYMELKERVQAQLIAELDPKMDLTKITDVRRQVEEIFNNILENGNIILTRVERARLFEAVCSEILGYGPIDPLLKDESIGEIMVNGPKQVYVERGGKLVMTDVQFQDNEHVMRIIERIVSPLGRRIDESSPYVDARLPDGSRVNAVIPPIAVYGPVITIRKFSKDPFHAEDLIKFGTLTPEMVTFLKACVEARLNILVSGGTGSGKTTTLNVLSDFIPPDERIITVENAAELQLRQEHVVTLESRAANIEGRGEISIQQLVVNCLRMRPDRIIVGECRGGEALDMLQAMNTGHDGSLTTLHANSPRDALARLETMVLMSGHELPVRAIREQIASAVQLILQQTRMKDGTRKVTAISEVQGMEGDVIVMQDVFTFEQTGIENGKIVGRMKPTGIRPKFVERFEAQNIYLPPNIFGMAEKFF